MDKAKLLAILDKHIDQQGLAKDLAVEFAKGPLVELKAKIESGEVDLVKGTDLDKALVIKVIDLILEKI